MKLRQKPFCSCLELVVAAVDQFRASNAACNVCAVANPLQLNWSLEQIWESECTSDQKVRSSGESSLGGDGELAVGDLWVSVVETCEIHDTQMLASLSREWREQAQPLLWQIVIYSQILYNVRWDSRWWWRRGIFTRHQNPNFAKYVRRVCVFWFLLIFDCVNEESGPNHAFRCFLQLGRDGSPWGVLFGFARR